MEILTIPENAVSPLITGYTKVFEEIRPPKKWFSRRQQDPVNERKGPQNRSYISFPEVNPNFVIN